MYYALPHTGNQTWRIILRCSLDSRLTVQTCRKWFDARLKFGRSSARIPATIYFSALNSQWSAPNSELRLYHSHTLPVLWDGRSYERRQFNLPKHIYPFFLKILRSGSSCSTRLDSLRPTTSLIMLESVEPTTLHTLIFRANPRALRTHFPFFFSQIAKCNLQIIEINAANRHLGLHELGVRASLLLRPLNKVCLHVAPETNSGNYGSGGCLVLNMLDLTPSLPPRTTRIWNIIKLASNHIVNVIRLKLKFPHASNLQTVHLRLKISCYFEVTIGRQRVDDPVTPFSSRHLL